MRASAGSGGVGGKARLFRGFSDPSRLAILEALREGPRTVTALVAAAGLSQSNTSNHLNCLLGCGLVRREQRGRFALYRLADGRVERLLGLADELLAEVATGVHGCAHGSAPAPGALGRAG